MNKNFSGVMKWLLQCNNLTLIDKFFDECQMIWKILTQNTIVSTSSPFTLMWDSRSNDWSKKKKKLYGPFLWMDAKSFILWGEIATYWGEVTDSGVDMLV